MSDIAICVEGLSKRDRLGQREALTRAATAPFRHLRSTFQPANVPSANGKRLWELRDVSFEIK